MLTVIQLANQSGATPNAVRYYTRMGLLQPERNPSNGYKIYQFDDINWLRFIQRAKQLGFTLNEIKAIMTDADQGQSPCPRVREILQHRIVENKRHMEELLVLQDHMERALLDWQDKPDGVPDGDSICHLIESFSAAKKIKKNNF